MVTTLINQNRGPRSHGAWSRTRTASLLLFFTALSGCSDGSGETDPPVYPPYALSVITFGADNTLEGSIKFASSLESTASIDETLTLESTGVVPLYPAESSGKLLNALGKSGEIVKYAVAEDGSLQQEGEKIGFAGYGINAFRAPIIPIVSPTKAYLWDDLTFKTVIWDPSTMSIKGEIEGVAALFKDKNVGPDGTTYWTFRARFPIQVGNKVYESISYLDEATIQFVLPYSGMAIIDADTDQFSFVMHPTCAGLENFMLAPDGYIYLTSNSYAAANYIAGVPGINPPCFVRFDPKTGAFDDSFQVDLEAGPDGKVSAGLVQQSGSSAYVRVFNQDKFSGSLTSVAEVRTAPAWDLYLIEDVASPTLTTPVDQPATSALLYPFEVDGHMHAATVDYSDLSSSLFDMSTIPPTPGLDLDGITSFAMNLKP